MTQIACVFLNSAVITRQFKYIHNMIHMLIVGYNYVIIYLYWASKTAIKWYKLLQICFIFRLDFFGSSSCESRFFLWHGVTGPKTSTLSAIFKGLCCGFCFGVFHGETQNLRQFAGGCSSPKNMVHLFGFTPSPSLFCLEIPPQREISKSYFWLITLTLAIDTFLPLLGEPFLVSSSCHLHVTYGTTIFIPKMKVIGWTLNPYGSFIKVLSNLEPGLKKTSRSFGRWYQYSMVHILLRS